MVRGNSADTIAADYGPPRLIVELTNICNLHCSYCLRDEDDLYNLPATFFPVELLTRIMREARAATGIEHVMFTGGEPTLHPHFGEIISAVEAEELKCSFVTNGWHFERVWPAIRAKRGTISHVAFSVDGATQEAHDAFRGDGSFVRLVRAFACCQAAGVPFALKTIIKRSTISDLEQIALFAARMGATAIDFAHLLPTSDHFEREQALNRSDRVLAEQEVAMLARILKLRVTLNVGYINLDPRAPCSALAGVSCSIDYHGRLSLCCNLSGYRGAAMQTDVIADLNAESFGSAYARLRTVAEEQVARRAAALATIAGTNEEPDVWLGSPCLFCLQTFDKAPWRTAAGAGRALPVLPSAGAAARG